MLDLLLIVHEGADATALADAVAKAASCKVGWVALDAQKVPPARWALALLLHEGKHSKLDAPRIAERATARLMPPLAPCAVAEGAADAVEAQAGRRCAALFVVRDWVAGEALVAELYAASRRFSHAAIAALDAPPALSGVLAELVEDGAKRLVLQPMAVFAGAWQQRVERAAAGLGLELSLMPPLGEQDWFRKLIVEHIQTQQEAFDGDSD